MTAWLPIDGVLTRHGDAITVLAVGTLGLMVVAHLILVVVMAVRMRAEAPPLPSEWGMLAFVATKGAFWTRVLQNEILHPVPVYTVEQVFWLTLMAAASTYLDVALIRKYLFGAEDAAEAKRLRRRMGNYR